ncbi:hypothetical protein TSAR_015369 [Trichomalopsis sarcophagae]|uniref:Non-structural maintenance of chromosomes element 1 homolog n=1 Tax=Trichomalopsis sarcophagae TaxID=543379 RepID=A0A232EMU8_9HYME|nr:hypothetical protein TSAR_015369 [Trichomalopsis sarcophagae]
MNYDDRHRAFLQAIMQMGIVLDHDAQLLCATIFKGQVDVSMIANLINIKLTPINLLMKCGMCELSGEKYWSVVGTTHEENLSIPSKFSVAQRALLRDIYSEIISSEDGSISSTDGLNLTRTIGVKLSMGEADAFLKDLYKGKWLCIKNGYIYMGVRSILELMPYFRATYENNFHNCQLCKEIIFYAKRCKHCDKAFHNYCLVKYMSQKKESVCPDCKNHMDISIVQDNASNSESIEEPVDDVQEDEPMEITDEDSVIEDSPPVRKTKKTRAK